MRILADAARAHAAVLNDPAPVASINAFADSGINLELLAWSENALQKLSIQTALNLAIYRAFTAQGISIPYPQREARIVGDAAPPAG